MRRQGSRLTRGAAGALLVVLHLCAAPAAAQVLRFVQDQSVGSPLLEVVREDGDLRVIGGLTVDLNRAIAAELGLQPVFAVTPRKRLEQALQDGSGDVLCYMDPKWFLQPDAVQWSEVYVSNGNLLVSGPGVRPPARLQDLRAGRIGAVSGYVYPEMAEVFARPGITRDDAPGDDVNFRKLLAHRTEYLITHRLFLDYRLREQPEAAALLAGRLPTREFDTRCAISPRSSVSVEAFNAALRRLRASGAYDDILKRYR